MSIISHHEKSQAGSTNTNLHILNMIQKHLDDMKSKNNNDQGETKLIESTEQKQNAQRKISSFDNEIEPVLDIPFEQMPSNLNLITFFKLMKKRKKKQNFSKKKLPRWLGE